MSGAGCEGHALFANQGEAASLVHAARLRTAETVISDRPVISEGTDTPAASRTSSSDILPG